MIRVRVSRTGKARYLVDGSNGARYTMDPADWSCSCPDAHRHGKGCKHALACWVLSKATRPATRPKTARCDGCSTYVYRRDLLDVPEGNITFFESERVCHECARAHGVL